MRPDNFLLRRAAETNPTDVMTLAEITAAPAKRAAAIEWLGHRWINHDRHFLRSDDIQRHASTLEMLRPLWQRTRGVGDRSHGLNDLRQRMRLDAHYGRQNERDMAAFFTTDRSAVR